MGALVTLVQLLFSFKGRINRAKWWFMFLLGKVIGVTIGVSVFAIFYSILGATPLFIVPVLLGVVGYLWPLLAVSAKRWHDHNKSAWWVLIQLIPGIGALWAIVELGCLRGNLGPNRFGPDPLEHL